MKKKYLTFEKQLQDCGIEIAKLRKLLGDKKFNELTRFSPQHYSHVLLDLDLQQFVGRYKTEGLPNYLSSTMLERLLYFRGSFVAFIMGGVLYCLPYAIDGDLNVYGLPTKVKPIGLNGEDFPSQELIVDYVGIPNPKANCVIIYDRTPVWQAGNIVNRGIFNHELRELLAQTLSKAEINLYNSSKKMTYKVDSQDQIDVAQNEIDEAYYSTDPYVVISSDSTGEGELFNNGIENELEQYMQFYASINNLRCYQMGILNNGTFLKSERSLTAEISGNDYQTNLILENGLQLRENEGWRRLEKLYPQYSWLKDIHCVINVDPYIIKGQMKKDDDYAEENREGKGQGINDYNNNTK